MAYKQISPVPVVEGGTEKTSFTAYAVITGGTTTTGALQSIASVGSSGQVLTSNGTSSLPTFQAAPNGNVNVVFDPVSSDPGSPAGGDVWFNTTSNAFKGYDGVGTATVTFTVT